MIQIKQEPKQEAPLLERIIQQAQVRLSKALFKYQVAQYNYAYAIAELDKYQDEYFRERQRFYYTIGGYQDESRPT